MVVLMEVLPGRKSRWMAAVAIFVEADRLVSSGRRG
jgi:hypothetical protein